MGPSPAAGGAGATLLSLSHGEGDTAPVGTAEGHRGVPTQPAPLNPVLRAFPEQGSIHEPSLLSLSPPHLPGSPLSLGWDELCHPDSSLCVSVPAARPRRPARSCRIWRLETGFSLALGSPWLLPGYSCLPQCFSLPCQSPGASCLSFPAGLAQGKGCFRCLGCPHCPPGFTGDEDSCKSQRILHEFSQLEELIGFGMI